MTDLDAALKAMRPHANVLIGSVVRADRAATERALAAARTVDVPDGVRTEDVLALILADIAGARRPMTRDETTAARRQAVAQAHAAGHDPRAISVQLGVPVAIVRRHLTEMEITAVPAAPSADDEPDPEPVEVPAPERAPEPAPQPEPEPESAAQPVPAAPMSRMLCRDCGDDGTDPDAPCEDAVGKTRRRHTYELAPAYSEAS